MFTISKEEYCKEDLGFAQGDGKNPIYKNKEEAYQDFLRMDSPGFRALYSRKEVAVPVVAQDGLYKWDVCGDFFDVGEVLSGRPECWLQSSQVEKPMLEIEVLYGVQHLYEFSDVAKWAFMLSDLYASCLGQYTVKLTVSYMVQGMKKPFEIVVSEFGEYLNEARLLYILSPLFYRMAVFAQMKKLGADRPYMVTNERREAYKRGPVRIGNKLVIPGLYGKYHGDKERDLNDYLRALG
jgi:hypothetical protein